MTPSEQLQLVTEGLRPVIQEAVDGACRDVTDLIIKSLTEYEMAPEFALSAEFALGYNAAVNVVRGCRSVLK